MKTFNDILRGVYQRIVTARSAKVALAERQLGVLRWGIMVAFAAGGPWVLERPDAKPWLIYTLYGIGAFYCAYMSLFKPLRRQSTAKGAFFTVTWQAGLSLVWVYAAGGIHSPFYVVMYAAVLSHSVRFKLKHTVYSVFFHSLGYLSVLALMGQVQGRVLDILARLVLFFVAGTFGLLLSHELQRRSAAAVKTEAALIEEHTRSYLAQIVETSGDAIIGLSLEGAVESWNPAAEAIYGYRRSDALGKPISFLSPAGASEDFTRLLESARNTGRVQRAQLTRVHKDGREITISLTLSPVSDSQGKIIAMSSISRDISTQEETQRQLAFQARLMANVSDAVVATDPDLVINYWNHAAEAIYGWTQSEAMGRSVSDLLATEFLNNTLNSDLFDLRETGRLFNCEVIQRRKDGTAVYIETAAIALRDDKGEFIGAVSVNRDISERKRIEQALHQQTTLYENLVLGQSDMGHGVGITDNEHFIYVNEALAQISGYTVEELLALPSFLNLVAPEEHALLSRQLQARVEGRSPPSEINQTVLLRKDGVRRDIEYAMKPMQVNDHLQWVGVVRDVTERKMQQEALARSLADTAKARDRERQRADDLRAANVLLEEANRRIVEEQLKVLQTEKLASIGMLAAGVAHEINNPLTGIAACVSALKNGQLSEERQAYYLDVIENALSRMSTTVNSLLGYARHQPVGATLLDARMSVASCLPLIAPLLREKRVDVDLRIPAGDAMVMGNASQLAQATMNVLLNAIHASPTGSQVTVWNTRNEQRVGIHFQDRGTGIPRQNLHLVCDPFFTTKAEGQGTGLGLSVTQGIVQNHGGELVIASEEGLGTTVTFWLPSSGHLHTVLAAAHGEEEPRQPEVLAEAAATLSQLAAESQPVKRAPRPLQGAPAPPPSAPSA
ncbi:MAG: PAS domain-containing sensor histidine kinase [Myxococcaceae bacterium]|nr:PAS domain-containing sensor histidine kinase [Myxococcaceae bacterium]